MNSATSIFAGFVVFAYLGYMASELNVPIEQVANSGERILLFVLHSCSLSYSYTVSITRPIQNVRHHLTGCFDTGTSYNDRVCVLLSAVIFKILSEPI